jgi:thiol-disulfide isomerase/thioredoxin
MNTTSTQRSRLLSGFFIGLIAALFLLLGIAAANHFLPQPSAEQQAVQQLFSTPLQGSDQQTHTLEKWRKDSVLVVNFWATWCAPCVQEMPELSALQQEYRGKHLQILGVGIDKLDQINAFGEKYQISYPLFAAGLQGTQLLPGLGDQAGGLPYTLLLGRDGSLIKKYEGRLNMAQLRADIEQLRP